VPVQFNAEQVIDSVGVCVHPTFSQYNTASLGLTKIITSMTDLGIRHYRTESYPSFSSTVTGFFNNARDAGLKAQLIADKGWGTNASGFVNQLAAIWTPAGISGIEGQNEPDNASTIASAKATQAALYPAIRADPRFDGIPFLNPSMAQTSGYSSYGNDGFEDALNMHSYEASFNTMPETSRLDQWITAIRNVFFDEAGKDLAQGHFGLVRADGTPKTSYLTIRNFMNRLTDNGSGTAPTSVGYTYTTSGTDVKVAPISRRDGSFDLAVWRAASIWDSTNSVQLNPAAVNVAVTLPTARRVERYRPNGGSLTTVSASTTTFTIPADGLVSLTRVI
jgi:hypothetical protein